MGNSNGSDFTSGHSLLTDSSVIRSANQEPDILRLAYELDDAENAVKEHVNSDNINARDKAKDNLILELRSFGIEK